jgi:uncharacterized membrane protein YkvA (DUF1232 family)
MTNFHLDYARFYTEHAITRKIKQLGADLLGHRVLLYIVLTYHTNLTTRKIMITGALGYLICPFDAIPDCIPIFGYTDDLTVLAGIIKYIEDSITPEIKEKARLFRERLF